ncbi:MAG TPA: response regulator [Chthoniobacteraceae bacterium]|jgi:CheY-like chemotaxis protein/CHASE3 domain sensor protein|nr:response regulator [Chthoniobacteraceae bacterium]
MPVNALPKTVQSRTWSSLSLLASVLVLVAFFIITAWAAFLNTRTVRDAAHKVDESRGLVSEMEDVLSLLKDAETGQRGYVITGDEKYLAPYDDALPQIEKRLPDIEQRVASDDEERARMDTIQVLVKSKLDELARTIALRRTQGFEAARAEVATDRGMSTMDQIRSQFAELEQDQRKIVAVRFDEAQVAFESAVRSGVTSAAVGIVLTVIAGWLLQLAARARLKRDWLRTGQTKLTERLIGDQTVDEVAGQALQCLCQYLDAKVGTFFVADGESFRRAGAFAVPSDARLPARIASGDGLLGQAAKLGRALLVKDVPEGYLAIGSSLGQDRPRHLLISPAMADNAVTAVIEFGFFEPVTAAAVELLDECAEAVGIAIASALSRQRIVELLEETQRQSEELQTQGEELRVSNEELEEQARALQESQARLEQQQVEMEQVNLQLTERTELLQNQRNDLAETKTTLERQAAALDQASRYKSDFLANMSHELRTPLNSSLILAQLLAENRGGNLTAEQIRYATTIKSAGNDLLALINDVLDLSKIEAGRMDVRPQKVFLARLMTSLTQQFDPVAATRSLALRIHALENAPASIETDPQRLEQILRNLLSNALKFTEQGTVELEISEAGIGRIAFAVRDTGIGIDESQQRIVFEPFCQADGTTNRRYGGTGLGLSISRELARLLGGEITLQSRAGAGSVFTLLLPETLQGVVPRAPAPMAALPAPEPRPRGPQREAPQAVADDRDNIDGARKVILVVEDDPNFAEVLASLGREQKFKCLVTATAQEALSLARQYMPSGILLDVNLPDASGLAVLERLKNEPATRHIPVHVISASDYAEKALELGALGYLLKPVAKERLIAALQELEGRMSQRLKRVLVVEDNAVQRDALCGLLASREVEVIGAKSAADCLEHLEKSTFDCMVLDLSLPDASGFVLLDQLSSSDRYAFPPVIIYTGRELTTDEEQRLRRHSQAIIIKGAKSPERLLDEVALFLHQVVADLPREHQEMIAKARSREAALDGKRVLLAEDDVRNVFALTSLLEPYGLNIEIARNGKEVLDALEQARNANTRIDLVLMDIMMPEMDGLTAIRRIRQDAHWKRLPIIALTAKAMPNDQQECLEAGANDYLSKPLNVEKLLSLVRVWMPR